MQNATGLYEFASRSRVISRQKKRMAIGSRTKLHRYHSYRVKQQNILSNLKGLHCKYFTFSTFKTEVIKAVNKSYGNIFNKLSVLSMSRTLSRTYQTGYQTPPFEHLPHQALVTFRDRLSRSSKKKNKKKTSYN